MSSKRYTDDPEHFVSMKTIWHKAHPILSAIGVHIFVLGLLCLSFVREPERQQTPSAEGAIVEATLVSAPPQSESMIVDSSPSRSSTKSQQKSSVRQMPSHQQDSVSRAQTQPFAKQAPEQQVPIQFDERRKQPRVDPSEQQQGDGNPTALAQRAEPEDPFAEMRRQRAEAERQRQLTAQGIKQAQEQRAQQTQTDALHASASALSS